MNPRYIFVEGPSDERFIKKIICPSIDGTTKIIQYARDPPRQVNELLRTLRAGKKKYLFITDMERKPCITETKTFLKKTYDVDEKKIVVMKRRIESIYYAGIDFGTRKKLRIKITKTSEEIEKTDFEKLIPGISNSVDIQLLILESFSYEEALKNNASFRYLCDKIKENL